ncbi:MAG: DUF167 domain-containing protein [Acidimicrobiaceae bacterium]|nr:DUF167 domain-containing protein [Acidimicrobiaceae bacterium]
MRVYVLVKPSSRRLEIKGVKEERLEVLLTAPAKENKANVQLVSFFSDSLNIPKSAISVLVGNHGRKKTVGIGPIADPQGVARKLTELSTGWSLGA